jgi:hypothetical protein
MRFSIVGIGVREKNIAVHRKGRQGQGGHTEGQGQFITTS